MIDTKRILPAILDRAQSADLSAIRSFLTDNPSLPLVATGSGGCESVADFAALLYGARGGMALAVSPYTLNSFSDDALRTGKVLLLSKGGHNHDIVYASRRALEANAAGTAFLSFSDSDGNEARKVFGKAGSDNAFIISMPFPGEGFVSTGTSFSYFSILTRIFQPGIALEKYKTLPETLFTLCLNDGTPLGADSLDGVKGFMLLHGSWGRPVARNLENKLVETGLAAGCLCDYRNYCHGRFIFTSNHLEDSAIVLFVSPREKDIAGRIRRFLPAAAKLVIIETQHDAPEASLDLLIRATEFFLFLCKAAGASPVSPGNPGKIDKRVPIRISFMTEMKKNGPLGLWPKGCVFFCCGGSDIPDTE